MSPIASADHIVLLQQQVKEMTELRKIAFDYDRDSQPPISKKQSHADDYKKLGFHVSKCTALYIIYSSTCGVRTL